MNDRLMNITKSQFAAYIKGQIGRDRKVEIDAYLDEHPLERKALEGAMAYDDEGSFDVLVSEIDSLISSETRITKVIALTPNENEQASQRSTDNIAKSRIKEFMRYAVAVAAALLMLFLIRTNYSEFSTEDISSYIDSYPDVITNVVRGNEQEIQKSDLIEAMTAYNDGDMSMANELLTIENNLDQENKSVQFYLAITDMHLGHYEKSLSQFEKLIDVDFAYEDGALWYQSLCLLSLDRVGEAKLILENISEGRHYKKNDAIEILNSL